MDWKAVKRIAYSEHPYNAQKVLTKKSELFRGCSELRCIQSHIWQYCGLKVGILGT